MQQKYNPHAIEREAQRHWEEADAFRAVEAHGQAQVLLPVDVPVPLRASSIWGTSGTIPSAMCSTRYHRMKGYNVLQPMGWDAFGLPAENAAMANGVPPAKWTYDNIAYMKKQLKSLGFAIDWSRELATCKPDYYRWNQWFFLRMLERGIAYKKTGVVNWDPVDQTVLANEQVIDGRGWRTGALVEKREIPMYYLAITRYADELLAALDTLPGWPERVKAMQANWIGKSHGVRFAFTYERRWTAGKALGFHHARRHDHGCDFCRGRRRSIRSRSAPRATIPALAAFVDECKRGSVMEADLATVEKKGMPTGIFVDASADRREDRSLGRQLRAHGLRRRRGDGRARARPARFRVRDAVQAADQARHPAEGRRARAAARSRVRRLRRLHEFRQVRRPRLPGGGRCDRRRPRTPKASARSRCSIGCATGASRASATGAARYRSCTAPTCGDVPVPDDQLPVVLPEDCVPDGTGNPLDKRADFVNTSCPKCGARGEARDRHDGHLRRFVVVLHALRVRGPGQGDGRRARRLLAAGRSVHRRHRARDPAPALFALLDEGDARSRARQGRRAFHEPAHAGHGAERDLLPQERDRAASSTTTRPKSR